MPAGVERALGASLAVSPAVPELASELSRVPLASSLITRDFPRDEDYTSTADKMPYVAHGLALLGICVAAERKTGKLDCDVG